MTWFRRFQRQSLSTFLLGVVVFLVFGVNLVLALQDRSQVLDTSAIKLKSHLRLLAEHSSGLFKTVDISLISLAEQISHQGQWEDAPEADLARLVSKAVVHMPQASNLYIFDAVGNAKYIMHPGHLPALTIRHGGFFLAHKNKWQNSFVESLSLDDISQSFLLISRRLNDSKGNFDGVVVAALSPATLYQLELKNDADTLDAVVMLDSHNRVLAVWPDSLSSYGGKYQKLTSIPYFANVSEEQLFRTGLQTHQDNVSITAFFQLRNFPIRLGVAYDVNKLLAPWYERRTIGIIVAGSLGFLALWSAFLSFRQRRMRTEAEKALDQSEKHYRTLAENFPESIILLFNTKGVVNIADGQGLVAAGFSKADIEGKKPDQFLPFALAQLVTSHHRFVLGGRRTTFTIPMQGRVYQAHSLPLMDDSGTVEAGMTVLTDITRRQEYEAALRRAKDAAEMASSLKGQFVANISHELRTPISGIMGITDVALSEKPPAKWRRHFELISNVSDGLLGVINDILDFSRMEADKMTLEAKPLSLRTLLEESLAPLRLKASQKNVQLTIAVAAEVPECIEGDGGRIRQVLVNLVDNAIKFTENGLVQVEVHLANKKSENRASLLFNVIDTGCGIPADKQEKLFESFFQVDGSLSRHHGGSGLGLAISKRLVNLMGGDLQVQSKDDRGSRFYFTLHANICAPREESQPMRAVDIVPQLEEQAPLYVLLAEDNELNQEFLTYFLEERGHTVRVASNGLEALELLKKEQFGAILMDVQMPEMSGIEATRLIRRSSERWSAIPIVALTAHAMAGDKERFLGVGMDAFVGKPVNKDKLFEALQVAQQAALQRGWGREDRK